MVVCWFRRYFQFLASHKSAYLTFNKQLLVAELVGFGAGVVVAEAAQSLSLNEFSISILSSISDYTGSVLGFLAIYYHDTKHLFKEESFLVKLKKVMRSVLGLWVSIISADIAFLVVRPYFQYLMLVAGIEAGLAGALAHFMAFAVFNLVAIFSRRVFDYVQRPN